MESWPWRHIQSSLLQTQGQPRLGTVHYTPDSHPPLQAEQYGREQAVWRTHQCPIRKYNKIGIIGGEGWEMEVRMSPYLLSYKCPGNLCRNKQIFCQHKNSMRWSWVEQQPVYQKYLKQLLNSSYSTYHPTLLSHPTPLWPTHIDCGSRIDLLPSGHDSLKLMMVLHCTFPMLNSINTTLEKRHYILCQSASLKGEKISTVSMRTSFKMIYSSTL